MLTALAARLAESFVGKWFAGSFLAKIPRGVWEAAAVLGYALALYLSHARAVHDHDAAVIAGNNAQWQAKLNAEVAKMSKLDAQLAADAAKIKEANDEENSRIASDAGSLRLRGPGKATCPRLPGAPNGSSGHSPTNPGADDAGPALPSNDSAAVPWGWLVDRAQEHDSLRAEVVAWRVWYADLVAKWPKQPPIPHS